MPSGKIKKLSASLEDYLEVIYALTIECEVARSKDIASELGVARPSVTGALKSLADKGYVNYRPYGYVTLTEKGLIAAKSVSMRHEVIGSFFEKVLGVDPCVAQKAACRAEHALGPVVMEKLIKMIDFVDNETVGENFVRQFKQYCLFK